MKKKNFKFLVEFGFYEFDSFHVHKVYLMSKSDAVGLYNRMSIKYPGKFVYSEVFDLRHSVCILKDLR